jgi:hypothetical protein
MADLVDSGLEVMLARLNLAQAHATMSTDSLCKESSADEAPQGRSPPHPLATEQSTAAAAANAIATLLAPRQPACTPASRAPQRQSPRFQVRSGDNSLHASTHAL